MWLHFSAPGSQAQRLQEQHPFGLAAGSSSGILSSDRQCPRHQQQFVVSQAALMWHLVSVLQRTAPAADLIVAGKQKVKTRKVGHSLCWAGRAMLKMCGPRCFVPSSGAASTHLFAPLQAAAKRFKVTAGGKVMMRHPGKQHINEKMSSKRLSKLGKEHAVSCWGGMPGQARPGTCCACTTAHVSAVRGG